MKLLKPIEERERKITCNNSFSGLCLIAITLLMGVLYSVNSYSDVHTSVQSGNWEDPATWDLGVPDITDDVVITDDKIVQLPNSEGNQIINNFTINLGGRFNNNNKRLTVTGNYINNGVHTGSIAAKTTLTGSGIIIDGVGTIHFGAFVFANTPQTILPSANITKAFGWFQIESGDTVTNFGTLTALRIAGADATSTWINASGSTLNIGDILLNTGTLTASATGNTVNYYKAGNQSIKTPSANTYYNLTLSGTDIKTLDDNIIIDGNLTISSATFDVGIYNINIHGNWLNTGVFEKQTALVTFDGNTAQTITNSLGETFYDLTINKSAGNLILNGNITITDTLTMTTGNVNTDINVITLGTSTVNPGTLIYTSGTVIGKFERWINTAGFPYLFPIGTESNYRPALATFNSILGGGGSIISEFISSAPGSNGLPLVDGPVTIYNTFVEGYWDYIAANGMNTNNYDIELTGNGFTSFTITPATRLLTRSDAASDWTAEGNHIDAAGDTAKRSALITLSAQYAFGDTTNCTGPTTSPISGQDSVCTNEAGVIYSVEYTSPNTYYWIVTGGSIVSDTTDSITVDWGSTGMVGNVRVIETNDCSEGAPVDFPVDIHSLPTSSITGKTNVAEFSTDEPYSVTARAGYTYEWIISGGLNDPDPKTGQDTNNITVDWGAAGPAIVSVVANSACGNADTVSLDVNVYIIINSITIGDWDEPTTWDCNCVPNIYDNVRVRSTHTVTLTTNEVINHFEVEAAGVFDAAGKSFEVTGDFTLDGEYAGTTKNLKLSGAGANIDGAGSFTHPADIEITGGSKTILAWAVLTKLSGNFIISGAFTVNNYGNITLGGDLIGSVANSTWTNEANSTLNISGVLLNTGTLFASASNNVINYYKAGDQDIKLPNASQYYHLTSSVSGTKTIRGDLDIDGNLIISGTSVIDVTTSNYNINIAGDFTTTGIDPFVEQSGTVTFDGSSDQIIINTGGVDEKFYNLIVNKPGGAIDIGPNTDIIVSNLITLTSGKINTGTDMVILLNGATATSGSAASFVSGKVKKTGTAAFVFPIGKGTTFARLGISATLVSSTFEAEYFDTDYSNTDSVIAPLNNVSTTEYWILGRTLGEDVTVTLYWENADSSGIDDCTDLTVGHFSAGFWSEEPATASGTCTGAGSGSVVTDGTVGSFSPFTFGSKGPLVNPLPIELISFNAQLNGDVVEITWITASEINNDYFTVEKTKDIENFEVVAIVKGAGNSNSVKEYSAIDENPYEGVSYYRLKQTDFDGNYEYSDLVAVEYINSIPAVFNIYPNPVSEFENFYVSLSGSEAGEEVLIVVRDILGQELYSKVVFTNSNGEVLEAIDHYGRIPAGIYLIIGTAANEIYSRKLIIR